jgi:hypothetical protein
MMAWHNDVVVVWVLLMLLSLSFQFLSLLLPSINVNTFQLSSTMGVKTGTSTNKDRPPKQTSTVKSPQPTCSSSKSPTAVNVNSLIAKINLPKAQFNGVLTALGSPGSNIDGLDAPKNLLPPLMETDTKVNHPGSPTSIETGSDKLALQGKEDPHTDLTVESTVRINETPISDPPNITKATSAEKQAPSSILRHTPTAPPAETMSPPSNKESTLNIPVKGSIIDRQRKLYIEVGDDMHKKTFHVEDFFGLYPSWPIIELAISPSDNNKDDRMNHFVNCCASLFAEILYVDDTAAIALLAITDDSKDSYITN